MKVLSISSFFVFPRNARKGGFSNIQEHKDHKTRKNRKDRKNHFPCCPSDSFGPCGLIHFSSSAIEKRPTNHSLQRLRARNVLYSYPVSAATDHAASDNVRQMSWLRG